MSYIKRRVLTTSLRNVRDYFSHKRMPSARSHIKKQLKMDSLPDYKVPHDIIEYESGENPSILLQEKLM